MELLSEALKQGIAPAGVIAIYLIAIKFIDSRRENTQIKLSSEVVKSISDISKFLNDVTKNIIEKEKDKCRVAVEDAMFASAMRLVTFISSTIINNHIEDNKDSVLANIHSIVNNEFYTMFSTLSMYVINGVKASDYLNKDWMDIIEQDMVDIVYNKILSKEDKILSFTNKITLKFRSHITYVNNNVAK